MSIKDFTQKIKLFWANIRDTVYSQKRGLKIKSDLFIVLLIVLVGFTSFGLGKLSVYEGQKTPISITDNGINNINSTTSLSALQNSSATQTKSQSGIVFASKSGTKYYYPSCSAGNRVV